MITKEEVLSAQKAWKDYAMSFSAIKDDREQLKKKVREFYQTIYKNDEFSFKPTKAAKIPFRNNEAGFASYFIKGNPDYPEDTGFALNGFHDIVFNNEAIILKEHFAIASGIYTFHLTGGGTMPVEYTFVYEKDADGLKIIAHHSSAPFSE